MYFWRVELLKQDLASGALTEERALPYVLWLGGLTTLASTLPYGEATHWDYAASLSMVGVFLLGTVLAFRANGGAAGSGFLVRYVSLSWVLAIRVFVFTLPAFLAVLVAEHFILGEIPEETTLIEALTSVAFEVVLYWRIVLHIGQLPSSARGA